MSLTKVALERPTVAVVTGASAGVGRATAIELARRGFDVGLLARGANGLAGAVRDVEALGRRAVAVQADVADADAVERAAERVELELGPIDLWVNNAMTTVFAPFLEATPQEFHRATEVTYLGQVHGTMTALRRMTLRDRGHILNVGSALAYRGIPLQSAYCGAKFACRGFTESVRTELMGAGSNVRISMVHLPAVNTPQFSWCVSRLRRHPQPVPPIYQPEVAAEAIVAAALDGRRQKILGVYNTLIVWANKVCPGVVDYYVAATGVSSQLSPFDRDPAAPVDLWEPVDGPSGDDHGARGVFGDRARGMLDRGFLRSVPSSTATIVRSVAHRWRDVARTRRGDKHWPSPKPVIRPREPAAPAKTR